MSFKADESRGLLPLLLQPADRGRRGGAAVAAATPIASTRVDNPVKMPAAWDSPHSRRTPPHGIARTGGRASTRRCWTQLIEQALKNNPSIIATEERLKQAERNTRHSARWPVARSCSVNCQHLEGRQRHQFPGNAAAHGQPPTTAVHLARRQRCQLQRGPVGRHGRALPRHRWPTSSAPSTTPTWRASSWPPAWPSAYFSAAVRALARGHRAREPVSSPSACWASSKAALQQRRGAPVRPDRSRPLRYCSSATNLIPLENQLRQAETALGLLLGQHAAGVPSEGEPIEQLAVPEIAPWLPGELLLRRPDLAAAETDMASGQGQPRFGACQRRSPCRCRCRQCQQQLPRSCSPADVMSRNFSISGALAIAEGILNFQRAPLRRAQCEVQRVHRVDHLRQHHPHGAEGNRRQPRPPRMPTCAPRKASAPRWSRRSAHWRWPRSNTAKARPTLQEVLDAQRALFYGAGFAGRRHAPLTRLNTAVTLYVSLGGGWEGPSVSP